MRATLFLVFVMIGVVLWLADRVLTRRGAHAALALAAVVTAASGLATALLTAA